MYPSVSSMLTNLKNINLICFHTGGQVTLRNIRRNEAVRRVVVVVVGGLRCRRARNILHGPPVASMLVVVQTVHCLWLSFKEFFPIYKKKINTHTRINKV